MYGAFDVGALPPIRRKLDDELSWLARLPPAVEWAIYGDRHVRDFESHRNLIWTSRPEGTPPAFEAFLKSPELGRRIRSYTGCYIDFGWRIVPASDGGSLIHFLSDQQWVMHWLIYMRRDGTHAVIASTVPYGFDAPAVDQDQMATVAKFDVETAAAAVCCTSFNEFLYRYWIENEICFRLPDGDLTDEQREYLGAYE
jgi:hypothetical protein